jgi:opacity protein-like surface antigen
MKRLMSMIAGAALATVLVVPTADAQAIGQTRAVTFGIGGGASLPVSDLGDAFDTGWHGQAMLGFNALGLQLRLDGMYHSLPESGHDHDLRVIAGVLNANFMLAPGAMVQPYLSAGVGVYNLRLDEDDDEGDIDTTEFGLNGGAGLRFNLAGLSTFVEARYHYIFTDGTASQLIPITVGITF